MTKNVANEAKTMTLELNPQEAMTLVSLLTVGLASAKKTITDPSAPPKATIGALLAFTMGERLMDKIEKAIPFEEGEAQAPEGATLH